MADSGSPGSEPARTPDAAGASQVDTAGFIALLPDIPRWLETRSLLLAGDARSAAVPGAPAPTGIVASPRDRQATVVGQPPAAWIRRAADEVDEILAPPESAAAVAAVLPAWSGEEAILHTLSGAPPRPPAHGVRLLGAHEIPALRGPDAELREELEDAVEAGAEIAAALVDGQPVAFCYAGSVTESLWDVAIDTLEPYRRQGHAARAAAFVIARMQRRGRLPVWGALVSNAASLGLAARLGFEPADRIFVFARADDPAPAP